MTEHIGSLVSVDCGSTMGVFQGYVIQVDPDAHTITLKDPKRNGEIYPVCKVTLRAADMQDLKIIQTNCENGETVNHNNVSPNKKLHHSKSFQNDKRKSPNGFEVRRRSQTPDLPNQNSEDIDLDNENVFDKLLIRDNKGCENNRRSYRNFSTGNGGNFQYLSEKDTVLAEDLDYNMMEDDFDFEANLALFKKLDVKGCSPFKQQMSAVPSAKKNIGHNEFVLQNPFDVYSKPKTIYKYRTEQGSAAVCALSAQIKRDILENVILADLKTKFRFVNIYSTTISECILDSLCSQYSKDLNVGLTYLKTGCKFLDDLVYELMNNIQIHLENRSHIVNICTNDRSIPANVDVLVFFGSSTIQSINLPLNTNLIFVETDFTTNNTAASNGLPFSTNLNFKSIIFWHFPISDCDVKSNSIYLCDVGLTNLNTISEKYKLKMYQCPFGARFITKLLKM